MTAAEIVFAIIAACLAVAIFRALWPYFGLMRGAEYESLIDRSVEVSRRQRIRKGSHERPMSGIGGEFQKITRGGNGEARQEEEGR